MVSCCVGNCAVTRKHNPENYTFHRVPHHPLRREKWIRIINRPDWIPYKNSYLCSKHFEQKCFIQREHRRFLMKDSIPTLFVPAHVSEPSTSYSSTGPTLSSPNTAFPDCTLPSSRAGIQSRHLKKLSGSRSGNGRDLLRLELRDHSYGRRNIEIVSEESQEINYPVTTDNIVIEEHDPLEHPNTFLDLAQVKEETLDLDLDLAEVTVTTDDIDIEEHDILKHPKVKHMFPDLAQVKDETPDLELADPLYTSISVSEEDTIFHHSVETTSVATDFIKNEESLDEPPVTLIPKAIPIKDSTPKTKAFTLEDPLKLPSSEGIDVIKEECDDDGTPPLPPLPKKPRLGNHFSNTLAAIATTSIAVAATSKASDESGRVEVTKASIGNTYDRPSISFPLRPEFYTEGSEVDDELDNTYTGLRRTISVDENSDETSPKAADSDAIDDLPGISSVYNWEKGFETFTSVPETFSGPVPGPIKAYKTPYEAFTDIFSADLVNRIVVETNRYAQQVIEAEKSKTLTTAYMKQWTETNADEIYILLAVYMYMGIDPRPFETEFWHPTDCLELPKFKQLLSHDRFMFLTHSLHFVNNVDLKHQKEGVPKLLLKVAPVITYLNTKFSSIYNLSREISINESLLLFNGYLSDRSKQARGNGMKSYELRESSTGYVAKFVTYTGLTRDETPDLGGTSTKIVLDLLNDVINRGHRVTMDDVFNSPALARYIKSKGSDCLGPLRLNRKNVPTDLSETELNTVASRQCGDISIITWTPKLISMISTYHSDTVETTDGKALPVCVRDYNDAMRSIDEIDQDISSYLAERRRTMKWYMKIFRRLLNVSVHNAFVMYNAPFRERNMTAMNHREFRFELARTVVARHHPGIRDTGPAYSLTWPNTVVHVPNYTPDDKKGCVKCFMNGKVNFVHSMCCTCAVYLCFGDCWAKYHCEPVI